MISDQCDPEPHSLLHDTTNDSLPAGLFYTAHLGFDAGSVLAQRPRAQLRLSHAFHAIEGGLSGVADGWGV